MPIYKLGAPTAKGKRYSVVNPDGKRINFGAEGGSTFIDHKDEKKKKAWIARHSKMNENWTYSGRDTAGFWSRYLLWSADNLRDAIKYIKNRFGIEVKLER